MWTMLISTINKAHQMEHLILNLHVLTCLFLNSRKWLTPTRVAPLPPRPTPKEGSVISSEMQIHIFGCSIDAAQQQMALNFEIVVSDQLFSVGLSAYK